MRMNKFLAPLLSLSLLLAPSIEAEEESSRSTPPIGASYLYNFKSDVDGGGEVSSHFFSARAGVPLLLNDDGLIALSAAYHLNSYEFSGGSPTSFAALNPWSDIHSARLAMPIRWKFDDKWSVFGLPSIRYVGEDGADFGDGISGGLLSGFSYKFSDRLTLGPGFGFLTQIEDDPSIFPIILIDWKLTDSISLTTGPATGATLGPGVELNWKVSDKLTFATGARYERLRFRLDSNSTASAGGIGQDRGIPVYGALSYQADFLRFTLLGGVSFGNELTLETPSGNEIISRDSDPAPFIGVSVGVTF